MFKCYYCEKEFDKKFNLDRHCVSCKVGKTMSLEDITKIIDEQFKLNKKYENKISKYEEKIKELEHEKSILISNSNNNAINSHNNTINSNNTNNINITLNAINKLDVKYLVEEHMLQFLAKVSESSSSYQSACVDYIHKILNNKESPENQVVKNIKKSPLLYDTVIEENGEKKNVRKNLNDTCQILEKPLSEILKIKMRECKKKYPDYVFDEVEEIADVIKCLKQLNQHQLPESIKQFLRELTY